ncbi:bi-domain-containing oxidoreductase [Desulfospira joergensenii]|uniref:bi-domain-containing oxidoreductase n=1 Tax=Desulfospira joergensenii TaxID=53329 RepID=UPI0003B3DFDD|nr:bi-domain-containing oxidoreductase [Desulfospira joergensenii]
MIRQVLQNLKTGETIVEESPYPQVKEGTLLIDTKCSLISAGTERMLVDFGRASYIDKARQQPEKVKMVLEKIKTTGLMTTIDAVRSKLDQPIAIGYSNVGVVHEVGNTVAEFKKGDRVVSNGRHADVVVVPKNLCAKIPDDVDDETAAFTVVASIGLQGIRLANPTIGETVVVIGVGLIGLIIVQLLRANGCRVLSVDFDDFKLDLARKFGSDVCNPGKGEDPISAGMSFSRGKGVDAVIIAAATKATDPITQAARMSRKRGRIVLVGVTGLELNRADFYEKELSFQVSCSYGPGRYDPKYEDQGLDYPMGFVRWTEQRNFEAILDLMSSRKLDMKPLISHRFDFDDAPKAYDVLSEGNNILGILMRYEESLKGGCHKEVLIDKIFEFDRQKPVVSFIGAGNYASRILIPAFKDADAQLHTIVTLGGTNGVVNARKAGFLKATSDSEKLFADKDVNTIIVATRHDSHASYVCKALGAGKNVFVEKPLCLNKNELKRIKNIYFEKQSDKSVIHVPRLMVGFNRRFSPHTQKIKSLLESINEPKSFIMTMNAGKIPVEHWTQDILVGGGRIIGEACHYVDLMRYLAGASIVSFKAIRMGNAPGIDVLEDKAAILLGFADGSFGTINYLANGANSFPKERIEVFVEGRVLQLDNFCRLKAFGWPGFKKMNLFRQDKGQKKCPEVFLKAIEHGDPSPIPAQEIFEVAEVSINIVNALRAQ